MNSNQYQKYLVVLGILIALQIYNWNEVKKDRVFEIVMLKEVKKI